MRIENIPRFEALSAPVVKAEEKTNEHGKTFQNLFNEALGDFNELSAARSEDRIDLLTGDLDDLHSLMVSGAKSGLANDMLWAMRNKMMDAYTEVLRFQV